MTPPDLLGLPDLSTLGGFERVLLACAAVLALTMLSVVVRMIIGPTILDRAVATDMLVVLLVIAMALYTAWSGEAWAGPAMLGLTGLAFIGTVAFARFVAREDPSRERSPLRREDTSTGSFEAIDLGRYDSAATPDPAAEGRAPEPRTAGDRAAEGAAAREEQAAAWGAANPVAGPDPGIPLNAHEEDPLGPEQAPARATRGAPDDEDPDDDRDDEAGFGLEDGTGERR